MTCRGREGFTFRWLVRKGSEEVTCEERPGGSGEKAMWVPGEELPASGQSKCKGLEAGMCPAALCPEGAAVVGGERRGWKQWEIEVGSGQITLSVGLLSEMQSSNGSDLM